MKLRYKLTLNILLIVLFFGIAIISNKALATTFLTGTICSLTPIVPNQNQLIKYQFTIPDGQNINGTPFPPQLNWIEGLDIGEIDTNNLSTGYTEIGHTQYSQASCIDNGTETICKDNLDLYLGVYPNISSQVFGILEIGYTYPIGWPGGIPVTANGPYTIGLGNGIFTLGNLDTWPYPICTVTPGTENPPVTSASFSPKTYTDGTYPDPVTVTLSSTVAYGFTIANTFYTIDGGSQQSYSTPFIISGQGNHTITYWSVDNEGVTEAANSKTFTIVDAPSVGSITVTPSAVIINSSVNASSTFTDSDTNSTDTAIWNWGDINTSNGTVSEANGSGTVGPDSHTYTSLGSFILSLKINNTSDGLSNTLQTVVAVVPTGGLTGSNLQGVNYTGADLSGQNISNSNLKNAIFDNADLSNANLSGSNLSMSGASFISANLTGANLTSANLSSANFIGANFTNAILTNTNIKNANLTNVNFTGANLTGANFTGATITGVTWSNTICPNGTNSNNDGGTCIGQGGGL